MTEMTPREIVEALDKHIIGQDSAKRAVAIALRNRWRRMQVEEPLRNEITPKNILMIGPTGVGKTEIARRLAGLANAPFIKVEATKYTEVGYVGRDVESMIRDLAEVSIKNMREQEKEKVKHRAEESAISRILDVLIPKAQQVGFSNEPASQDKDKTTKSDKTRKAFKKRLLNHELDDKEIEIELSQSALGIEIMAPPGMEDMSSQLQGLFQNISKDKKKKRKLTIKAALEIIKDEEAAKLINEEEIKSKAIRSAEQNGIVFIDEIDKVTARSNAQGADISREGVQRDLLPIVEGCTVNTKYGSLRTDHILFIASGAFQLAKPSDLVPELQGRLPIRVELAALNAKDFMRILTEPDASLTKQYQALMNTENISLNFTKDAIQKLAEIAFDVNEKTENIGARRLHTVMEHLVEELSFAASDMKKQTIKINAKYVDDKLKAIATDEDLSRYIL